jgi:hypothetical protein
MQTFVRFTLSERAHLFFSVSKMHIVCYTLLHAIFDVLSIIHVILLNIRIIMTKFYQFVGGVD